MSSQASRETVESLVIHLQQRTDVWLLFSFSVLLCLGLVMVASASVSVAVDDPMHFFKRQLFFATLGISGMMMIYQIRLETWYKGGPVLMLLVLFLLLLVLVPGVGKTVNGSTRWLSFGPLNLQVSEFAKLLMVIYLAGYMVRHRAAIDETISGFLKPVVILGVTCLLLLMEPDLGAAVVLTATVLSMLFLGRVKLWQFGLLLAAAACALFTLAISSSYRWERITSFHDPWADKYDSGYQLTQSLIAIGSGSLWGNGLGASVQKLFYLPEAHTDFVFAVMAEELGLIGVTAVVLLFSTLVYRSFVIGSAADNQGMPFAAYIAYGIGIWLGLQAFINMGVNMGMLPTKGLTLPLMSFGGSSMLVVCVAMGFVFRVHREVRDNAFPSGRRPSAKRKRRSS